MTHPIRTASFRLAIPLALWSTGRTTYGDPVAEARQQLATGDLRTATEALDRALKADPPPGAADAEAIRRERERLRRIERDFSLDRPALVKGLREAYRDFREEEIAEWEAKGFLDRIVVAGEPRWFDSAVVNLWYRSPEVRPRWLKTPPEHPNLEFLLNHLKEIDAGAPAAAGKIDCKVPRRFDVTMTVTVKADAVPAGKTVRCWLPYPVEYEAQRDIALASSEPKHVSIDRPDAPQRSVYLERPAVAGEPTRFRINYALTRYATVNSLPAKGTVLPADDPVVRAWCREQPPHVVFTPELRKLAAELRGEDSDPVVVARRTFDWVGRNIRYSYAPEYATVLDMAPQCRSLGHGDCGQEAMLFITLCRINGIPARWQTAWVIWPWKSGMHDWAEIYLAPAGWTPVDPYKSVEYSSVSTEGTPEERERLRSFYFGGMDGYRLVCNRDHGAPLSPPKTHQRSDDIDFQRGEVEWEGGNLYFDAFSYKLEAHEVPLK